MRLKEFDRLLDKFKLVLKVHTMKVLKEDPILVLLERQVSQVH